MTSAIYASIIFFCVFYGFVFSLNWKFGVVLFAFVTVLAANLFSLETGILPIMFLIPFDRLAKLNPEGAITFAKVFIGMLIVALAVKTLAKRDDWAVASFKDNPVFFFSLLFLAFSVISIFNAHDTDIFLSQMVRRVSVVALLFVMINVIMRRDAVTRALTALFISYFFIGLTGIYEIGTGMSVLKVYWGEDDPTLEHVIQGGDSRVAGPSGDPDFHANALLLPTMIGVMFFYLSRSWVAKAAISAYLLLMMVNLLGTASRGGLLSLIIAVAIFWFYARIRHKLVLAAAAAALFLVIFIGFSLVSPNAPTERYTGETGGGSIVYRIGWMKMAFAMIQDYPIIGGGTANFITYYNKYITEAPEVPRAPYWVHNSYLQLWAENGIFGLIAFLAVIWFCVWRMYLVVHGARDETLRTLALLLLSVVCGYSFFAGSSNILENENYWMVFAFTVVVYNLYKKEREDVKGAVPSGVAMAKGSDRG